MNISLLRGQEKKKKPGSVNVQMRKDRFQKPQKAEPIVKEEGEMSDNEEVYEQFKEVKWMEWCQDVMVEEMKTLKRLPDCRQLVLIFLRKRCHRRLLSFYYVCLRYVYPI
jgi:chromodomain-helicase-DNA-binding protein 1